RQCLFASLRIGLYDHVKRFYSDLFQLGKRFRGVGCLPAGSGWSMFVCPLLAEETNATPTTVMMIRIYSAITTGAIGITVAQPTDVVKVRMQAQSRGGQPLAYSSSLQAYRTIFRTEGLPGLWKGLLPNIARNSIVNVAELVC